MSWTARFRGKVLALLLISSFVALLWPATAAEFENRGLERVGVPAGPGSADGLSGVALVIGNSAYANEAVLKNPANDAKLIASSLSAIGFEVELLEDLAYEDMRDATRRFVSKATGKDIAIVYFAGHGLEFDNENYLLPIDAKLASDADLEYEAVTLSSLLAAVRPAKKLRLVILDACRTNPFAQKMTRSLGLSRSVPRGLAIVKPAGDVLVAYAAKAGTVALDGDGLNSPFSQALNQHIAAPGVDIIRVFGRVRDQVLKQTDGTQEPDIYGALSGDAVSLVPPLAGEAGAAVHEAAIEAARNDAAEARRAKELAEAEAENARNDAIEAADRARVAAERAQAAEEEAKLEVANEKFRNQKREKKLRLQAVLERQRAEEDAAIARRDAELAKKRAALEIERQRKQAEKAADKAAENWDESQSGTICNAAASFVNVRSGPSADFYDVVRKLDNYSSVTIIGAANNPTTNHRWFKVLVGRARGYVRL